jgi:transitional endoplasmic reticulum ATPase
MASSETFTFVESTKDLTKESFDDYVDILSAKVADVDIQFNARLRAEFPEMIITTTPASNVDLLYFAALGHAQYKLETNHDSVSRWRGYVPPGARGEEGFLGEIINYGRYSYQWGEEYFILFRVKFGYTILQYILKEPRTTSENPNTTSSVTDALLTTAGKALYKQQPGIFVFDNYWYKDKKLYDEVQKMTWDKVILDPAMKEDLTDVSKKFFDSKDIYDELGVPWKRGIMFHGPAGNGKTISVKGQFPNIAHHSR